MVVWGYPFSTTTKKRNIFIALAILIRESGSRNSYRCSLVGWCGSPYCFEYKLLEKLEMQLYDHI